MPEEPLQRVLDATTIAQPASIGPRQADREKDGRPKERKRRGKSRQSIEETLEEERRLRSDTVDDDKDHIDYHA